MSSFGTDEIRQIVTQYSKTLYVVLSIEHTDGTPFVSEDDCPVTITPLIDGYEPWRLNIFSLDAYCMDTTEGGIRYCLVSTDSLEIFANHRVCIAVFDGFVPSPDVFTINEDGVIGYNDSYTGAKAMFDLPLDPAKADPAAAAALVADREAERFGANGTTSSDDDSAFSEEATGATTASSIQQVDDEIIITNEYGDCFILAYEEDGIFHVYDCEGNELPAAGFEALINEKWDELGIDPPKPTP